MSIFILYIKRMDIDYSKTLSYYLPSHETTDVRYRSYRWLCHEDCVLWFVFVVLISNEDITCQLDMKWSMFHVITFSTVRNLAMSCSKGFCTTCRVASRHMYDIGHGVADITIGPCATGLLLSNEDGTRRQTARSVKGWCCEIEESDSTTFLLNGGCWS